MSSSRKLALYNYAATTHQNIVSDDVILTTSDVIGCSEELVWHQKWAEFGIPVWLHSNRNVDDKS